jgi:hypothetical protein
MDQVVGAGVHQHAQAIAETWQRSFQLMCGDQLCRHIGLDNSFSVSVTPSKRHVTDISEKEFKVDICHDLAEQIGFQTLLQGQFVAYPFNDYIRVRVKGCKGIINLHRACTMCLRFAHPRWANGFSWPRGNYALTH